MSATFDLNPAGFAVNGIVGAIRAMYHIVGDIDTFMDDHIQKMKLSENLTISRTGRVLEGVKYGFGLGYTVSVTVIALGQLLLGAQMGAMHTVGSAAFLSNPVAMTCAALGAVYYGWNALSEQEKTETIESLRKDLDVGAELIKSIVHFVISKTNELLDSENFKELKKFISEAAETFGKTLGDVTGAIKDKVVDAYHAAKLVAGDTSNLLMGQATVAFESVVIVSTEAGSLIKEHSSDAFETTRNVAGELGSAVSKTSVDLVDATKSIVSSALDSAKSLSDDASNLMVEKFSSKSQENNKKSDKGD